MATNRHTSHCSICKHPSRAEIEAEFMSWKSPAAIAREFRLGSRQAIFRHCKAMNLFVDRKANVRNTLTTLIERGLTRQTKVTPAVVIQAAVALSKLDAEGKTIERFQQVNAHTAFLNDARWTVAQMEAFAREGIYPPWYEALPDTGLRDSSSSKFRN